MKALCHREGLLAACQLASVAVAARDVKPILQHMKAVAENERCILMATDLELGLRLEVRSVRVEEPGEAILHLDRRPQPDGTAPVLDRDYGVTQVQMLDQRLDRGHVPVVRVPIDLGRFIGASEAGVVGCHDAEVSGQHRHHAAVEIGPIRLTVEQQQGRSGAAAAREHFPDRGIDPVRGEAGEEIGEIGHR